MLKKCLVVGVICLLMLVSIPMITTSEDYPPGAGHYTVFITIDGPELEIGNITGGIGITAVDHRQKHLSRNPVLDDRVKRGTHPMAAFWSTRGPQSLLHRNRSINICARNW